MSAFIVTVFVDSGSVGNPADINFFAVNAASQQKAEQLVIDQLRGGTAQIRIGSRAVPDSWPTRPGEVVYIP